MTEIKLTMADPARGCADLRAAAEACGHSAVASHLREMAAQIEAQVKPAIEEPIGDVVVWSRGAWWEPVDGEWLSVAYVGAKPWEFVAAGDPASFKIYRAEASS